MGDMMSTMADMAKCRVCSRTWASGVMDTLLCVPVMWYRPSFLQIIGTVRALPAEICRRGILCIETQNVDWAERGKGYCSWRAQGPRNGTEIEMRDGSRAEETNKKQKDGRRQTIRGRAALEAVEGALPGLASSGHGLEPVLKSLLLELEPLALVALFLELLHRQAA